MLVKSKDRLAVFDGLHEVIPVKLKAGAQLHRFKLRSGAAWSAIYLGARECMANPRQNERDMMRRWNAGAWLRYVDE